MADTNATHFLSLTSGRREPPFQSVRVFCYNKLAPVWMLRFILSSTTPSRFRSPTSEHSFPSILSSFVQGQIRAIKCPAQFVSLENLASSVVALPVPTSASFHSFRPFLVWVSRTPFGHTNSWTDIASGHCITTCPSRHASVSWTGEPDQPRYLNFTAPLPPAFNERLRSDSRQLVVPFLTVFCMVCYHHYSSFVSKSLSPDPQRIVQQAWTYIEQSWQLALANVYKHHGLMRVCASGTDGNSGTATLLEVSTITADDMKRL